jgi:hypothetical protein
MDKLFRAMFGVVLAGVALSPFYAGAAEAASLTVAVQQVGSNSAAQTVTCTAKCTLPLIINAGTSVQQSLNIQIIQATNSLVFKFQEGSGNFYASDTGSKNGINFTLWGKPIPAGKPATYDVTLFQPLVQYTVPPIAPGASANIAHSPVANLEITLTPVP